jgi:general secretion pathway protein L
MSTLIIALPLSSGDTTTRYEHVLTPDGQSIAVHATSTANLLPDASRGADETVAVVPAEALSWHRVELPKGVGAGSPRLRPVLQSLLEDRLLDDPQDLHLACEPSPAADRPIWIAACDKAWLSQHLQQLEAARRPVTRIVPEFAPHAAHCGFSDWRGRPRADVAVGRRCSGWRRAPASERQHAGGHRWP